MIVRSYLYIPGNRPEFMPRAFERGADSLVVDLEDSVPNEQKLIAREIVARFLEGEASRHPDVPVYVRINGDQLALDDIRAVFSTHLHGLRLPKAEDPDLVSRLDLLLTDLEQMAGREHGTVKVAPIIESVLGLHRMEELVRASRRIEHLIFGAGDFVQDIKGIATPSRIETLFARSTIVYTSRLMRINSPVAHVYTPISDLDGLRIASETDRAMGFYGRSCIHPSQIPVVNDTFSPTAVQVGKAKAVLAAYNAAVSEGRGSIKLDDGTFVDKAGAVRAADILGLWDKLDRQWPK